MIVHAVSIHSGGGKVLLDHLVINEIYGKISYLICDTRYELPSKIDHKIIVIQVKPTLVSRWKSELLLKSISKKNPTLKILCFSNLPPAFKLSGVTILYLQNALLLPGVSIYNSTKKALLRTIYERLWLKFFIKNSNEIFVQTNWMKAELEKRFKIPISIKPFLPDLPQPELETKIYDFITVTGAAEHKRLYLFLCAWENFSQKQLKLLIVTDSLSYKITSKLNKLAAYSIIVKVNSSRSELFKLYNQSKCLIVTSKIESFCLPIYEAVHFKLKIVAVKEPFNENLDCHFYITCKENILTIDKKILII